MDVINISIYSFLFNKFKKDFTKKFSQTVISVELRGSVAAGYSFFPFSDIDTTIILSSYDEIDKIRIFLKEYKRRYKFFVEFNIYLERDVAEFKEVFNCFDVQKDNTFKGKQAFAKFDEAQRIVFCLKTYIANINKEKYLKRFSKWQFYAQLAGFKECQSKEEFLNELVDEFEIYTNRPKSFVKRMNIFLLKKLDPVFSLPIWLATAFRNGVFEEELSKVLNLNVNEQSIIESQIKWEIYGLLGQMYTTSCEHNFIRHLENLKRVSVELDKVDHGTLINYLDIFIGRCLEFQSSKF